MATNTSFGADSCVPEPSQFNLFSLESVEVARRLRSLAAVRSALDGSRVTQGRVLLDCLCLGERELVRECARRGIDLDALIDSLSDSGDS